MRRGSVKDHVLIALFLAWGWDGVAQTRSVQPEASAVVSASAPASVPGLPVLGLSVAERWDATIKTLGKGLVESNATLMLDAVGDLTTAQTFDGRSGDPIRLLARTCQGSLILAKGYEQPPKTMASDLAQAAAETPSVPVDVQRRLVVRDATQLRLANAVGENWVAATLGAKPSDLVGVLAFWCERAAATGNGTTAAKEAAAGQFELVFVLVKGEVSPDGAPKVKAIVFGDASMAR